MERKTIWELAKEYPHAKFECFDHNGFGIKNVFVHDKIERYEVKNFHHVQDEDEWDEQVIFCYYDKQEEREKEAFVMAKELDKAITEALSFKPESVKELERKKQLVAEWKRRENELQKFIDDNNVPVASFGVVYLRGKSFNLKEGRV